MRAVRLLPVGLALLAGVLGCCRTINYTAGVCDCNPPDVTSVLVPPPRAYSPIAVQPSPYVKDAPTAAPPLNNGQRIEKLPTPGQQSFPEESPKLAPVPPEQASKADNAK